MGNEDGSGNGDGDDEGFDLAAVAEQIQQIRGWSMCADEFFFSQLSLPSLRAAQTGQMPDDVRRERAAHIAMALANALLGDDEGEDNDDDDDGAGID